MSYSRILSHYLARISLYDFRSYLEKNGWKRLFIQNSKWSVYRLGADSLAIEIVLPAEDFYADVPKRIADAITAVSEIEGCSPENLCARIVGTNSDSLLIRLKIPSQRSSIPVDDAPKHVSAIKNLVLYSACSEVNAMPYYDAPLSKAEAIVEDFNFCHTFQGSFGFEISSTIARPFQTDDMHRPHQARLVIERLARGFQLLDQAIEKDQPELLISAYERALNAKTCDAITEIALDGKVHFSFGIEWASCVLPSEDVRAFRGAVIGERQISMLKFVSEQLKVVQPHDDSVEGHVINLHCVSNPIENASRRMVALKVKHEVHGAIEVKLTLGQEDYLLAIAAHTQGKKLSATGQLQRKGSVWSVDAIVSIKIVE